MTENKQKEAADGPFINLINDVFRMKKLAHRFSINKMRCT